jgi:hypothetical protein
MSTPYETSERPKAYLIVAYYNRQKWRRASASALEQAEDAAEDLFPEEEKPLGDLAQQGEFMPRTFDSDLFGKTATSYRKKLAELQRAIAKQVAVDTAKIPTAVQNKIVDGVLGEIERDVRDQIVDVIYATQPPKTPVGWMVVVDEQHFASYIERMRGKGNKKGLWSVFDVEILPLAQGWTDQDVLDIVPPLRDDQTTKDIYIFMTPTSWGH